MKNSWRLLLAVLLAAVPATICGLVVWLPMLSNNLRLARFAENLYNYPLPPNTVVLAQHAEMNKIGNGNNCSYEVQQSMTSTLPPEEIEQYYEGVMLPRVSFGAQWDGMYDSPSVTEIRLEFDEGQSDEAKSFFILSLYDVGLDVTLDVRCH